MNSADLLLMLAQPFVAPQAAWAIAPLLAAFTTALLCFALYRSPGLQALASILGAGAQLLIGLFLVSHTLQGHAFVSQLSAWRAPFGITFYVDLFSALMLSMAALQALIVLAGSRTHLMGVRAERMFHPLFHFLLMGVAGCFSTGDLFNLYVWFEVLLLSSFVLMAMSREAHTLQGTFRYVTLNLLGSSVFLLGLGFLYNSAGTLNFAHLVQLRGESTLNSETLGWVAFALITAFAMKAAVFPLQGWLQASYPSTPMVSLAFFSGVLTKIGVYTLVRFIATPSALTQTWTPRLLLVCALLTMVVGAFGAATQRDFRRVLGFQIIASVGYLVLGIALGTRVGISAVIFYLLHHMVAISGLFLICGFFERVHGSSDLKVIGSGVSRHPLLAGLYAVFALALAGIPPLSGFWAKFGVLYAVADRGWYFSLGVGLFSGLLTLYVMARIWNEAFLKEADSEPAPLQAGANFALYLPMLLLAIWTVYLGIAPSRVMALTDLAAGEITEPQAMVTRVFSQPLASPGGEN